MSPYKGAWPGTLPGQEIADWRDPQTKAEPCGVEHGDDPPGREVADWWDTELKTEPSGLGHGGDLDPVQDEWPGQVVTGDYSNSGLREEGSGSDGLGVAADEADPLGGGGSDQDHTMPSATSSSLSDSRVHDDVTSKWKCSLCFKTFRDSSGLKKHLFRHTDARKYPNSAVQICSGLVFDRMAPYRRAALLLLLAGVAVVVVQTSASSAPKASDAKPVEDTTSGPDQADGEDDAEPAEYREFQQYNVFAGYGSEAGVLFKRMQLITMGRWNFLLE
ncbi:hypothetical protein FOCC_FOCC007746 [Frankliniella occidentalis]|nr:hypothetical protein FOCC_FOCC007746 [Frankliniella occidentalis]